MRRRPWLEALDGAVLAWRTGHSERRWAARAWPHARALVPALFMWAVTVGGFAAATRLLPDVEVRVLGRVAVMVVTYRLVIAVAHRALVWLASTPLTPVEPALSERLLRSVRIVGRCILVVQAFLIILFDRPFQVGDRVSFNGFYGEITKIGLRSVRLTTLDDNLITIPNNKFLTDIVSSGNAGALDMLVQMDFHLGLDQDVAAAKRVVRDCLTTCRYAFLDKPWAVLVSQELLNNTMAVRVRAKVYVLDVKYEKLMVSDVTERVLIGLREAGVAPPAILHRQLPAGEAG